MRLGKRGAQIVFAAATLAIALAYSIGVPDLFGLILTVLYLVLLGYLIECGLLPHTYWPFGQSLLEPSFLDVRRARPGSRTREAEVSPRVDHQGLHLVAGKQPPLPVTATEALAVRFSYEI